MDPLQPQYLLLASYIHAAERVRDALNGDLAVNNSRDATNHPSDSASVVGLCGTAAGMTTFVLLL